MKQEKLKLDVGTLRVESFRSTGMPEGGGTVVAHGPSARCPTAACTALYDGYTCPYTCAYTCI
ncbi:MAG TPA: hypothetical protein VFT45_02735 [Longimicrobium sp.]|nr:hypothetical protein [Longimicrobium sp.]